MTTPPAVRSLSAPEREARRLAALDRLRILDTLPEQAYEDIVAIASEVCGVPIALVSLIDDRRQWFKARVGLETAETPRDVAFCAHAILDPNQTLVVEDATTDARFADNPLVTGELAMRFYAGAPIVTKQGDAVGAVCVIDDKPGTLSPARRRCLEALARHAAYLLDTRTQAVDSIRAESDLLQDNERLEDSVRLATEERDRLWRVTEDLLLIATRDGRVLRVSPSWTRQLGHTEAMLLELPSWALLHPEDRDAVEQALARLTEDEPVSFENRVQRIDGHWRWIAWSLSMEAGSAHVSCVGRDITDAKERESQLTKAQDQLRQSQKMEAVGQLTGGLAHDFNNLLTGITGSLELLRIRTAQGRSGSELERYIATAQGAARRAAALTHRLLAFARRQTLDPRPVDATCLIVDMEDMIRQTIGPANQLVVLHAPKAWPVLIDANQLENALLNLCINARDAMPEGGRVVLETSNLWLDRRAAKECELTAGAYLSIAVTDSGTGMAPDIVARVFDPFFTTKPIGMGTGLGLSMVYGFARQSGGQVRVDSTVGLGTTMRLYLPRHEGSADRPSSDEPALAPPPSKRIALVVDDEPSVRMLVTEILEEAGCRTIEAIDGASALEVLQSDAPIDLLVTDVGLPGGINGRQVADAGRALRPGLKVLIVTGYAETAVLGNDRLGPGMQILTKPFTVDGLLQRIRDLFKDDG